jgi:hypothetical protein
MHTVGGKTAVYRRVETDYREAQDDAERRETMTRILSEGVYANLKKRGLLAVHRPHAAPKAAGEGHGPGAEILNE